MKSPITWVACPELPDDEVRVLFAAGDDVEVGHHADGQWITVEGGLYAESDVYAWAHLPEAPDLERSPR